MYNFKKTGKPQSNFYDYQTYNLDKSLYKYYQNALIPTLLYTDYGLLYDDYRLMETNFNPRIFYDPRIRRDSDPLFVFDFIVNQNFQMYYQKNQKINEIAGSLGGLINVIFLIGKLICFTYNSMYLRIKIVRATFSNPFPRVSKKEIFPKSNEKLSIDIIKSKIIKNLSFCKSLFPSKEIRAFYKKGSDNLHEFLDIRNIIRRLQDIDKFKMIILNENQRKKFECIPKPDLMETINRISSNSLIKSKKTRNSRITTKNFPNIHIQENDLNQNIMELLDSNQKSRLKSVKMEGIQILTFFYLFFFCQGKEELINSLNESIRSVVNPQKIDFNQLIKPCVF